VRKHLKNIFESGELIRESVSAFFASTASDGKTYRIEYYNLDAVISVGIIVVIWLPYVHPNALSQCGWYDCMWWILFLGQPKATIR
jgi:hypothetical protein